METEDHKVIFKICTLYGSYDVVLMKDQRDESTENPKLEDPA